MSPKTIKLHKQLTYTLIVQACSPILTIIVPTIIIAAFILIRIKIRVLGLIFVMIVPWFTVINPLSAIFLVKPYRNTVMKVVYKICLKSAEVQEIDSSKKQACVFEPRQLGSK
uniref:Uncharacterized protein n=1 Tax=Acrobeloides nanus TaxID=290746 RepID=A0A914EAN5_9BILA